MLRRQANKSQYDIISSLIDDGGSVAICRSCFRQNKTAQNLHPAKALVCINTQFKNDGAAIKSLEKLEGVIEAHSSTGLYSIIVVVQAESLTKLRTNVMKKIKERINIKSILTLTIIEEPT